MSQNLYIPVSTLNFNNLFSSESISPPNFYPNRNFGYSRFFKMSNVNSDNFILLFSHPPIIRITESEYEQAVFYIQIERNRIEEKITLFLSNGQCDVYICPFTIYFNLISPHFVFLSKSDIENTIAKSISSRESKVVSKYKDCFINSDEYEYEFMELDFEIETINEVKDISNLIYYDRQINSFKGFVYGLIIGEFFGKTNEEIKTQILIQRLMNTWGNLKSEIEIIRPRANKNRSEHTKISNTSIEALYSQIKDITSELKHSIYNVFKLPSDHFGVDQMLIKYGIAENALDDFKKNINLIPGLFEKLVEMAKNQEDKSIIITDEILMYMEQYIYISGMPYVTPKDKLDSRIKDRIYSLKELCADHFLKDKKSGQLLQIIEKVQFTEREIIIPSSFNGLDENESKIFNYIVNFLYKNNKKSKGDTEDVIKLELLVGVGNTITQLYGEESEPRKYLLCLYNLLINRSTEFNVNDINIISLKCFASFLIKTNSLEQLQEYLEINSIDKPNLAYSYWGAFNGFASISRTFTAPLFLEINRELVGLIDEYFRKQFVLSKVNNEDISRINNIDKKQNVNPIIEIERDISLKEYIDWVKFCLNNTLNVLAFSKDGLNNEVIKQTFSKELLSRKKIKPKTFNKQISDIIIRKTNFQAILEKLENIDK